MRLIDADKAKTKILTETAEHAVEIGTGGVMIMAAVADMLDSTEDFPTIEAEPVRHGKWDFTSCSICEHDFLEYADADCDHSFYRYLPNYCPNCGAKMDKEETR